MRPPNKSRSRNKNNRRSNNVGNSLNRVYDSAGPQGRVRGTPAQVIEKYQSLAHDSALSGDRVATENFQQHAEHYIRLMNEVQRQMNDRRDTQDQDRPQNQNDRQGSSGHEQQPQHARDDMPPAPNEQPRFVEQPQVSPAADVVESESSPDNGGLVETPEEKKAKPPRQRRPRVTKPAVASAEPSGDAGVTE